MIEQNKSASGAVAIENSLPPQLAHISIAAQELLDNHIQEGEGTMRAKWYRTLYNSLPSTMRSEGRDKQAARGVRDAAFAALRCRVDLQMCRNILPSFKSDEGFLRREPL